jgi:filamentous hemagglutinin family protein
VKTLGWVSDIWRSSPVAIILGCVSFLCSPINPVLAQSVITPDNTLGAEASRVILNSNGTPNELIEGGAQRGQNLFHSFLELNVGAGRGAYFSIPNTSIQNVLTRVTGSNPSEILGTLGTRILGGDLAAPNVNLYLINPNGILFGQNAKLDVGGAFVGSTANAIQFGELGFFSASNPTPPAPLLTINPSALLLNQIAKSDITSRSVGAAGQNFIGENITGLRVPDGKSLLLLGGNVNIDGSGLRAYGGRVELAALAAPGSVGLNSAGNSLSFSVPGGVERGNVSLTNGAEINVRGAGAGDISITARDVNITGGSFVRSGIDKGLGTPESQGGNIQVNATGTITLSGDGSRITSVLDERAFGKAGNIFITTGKFLMGGDASLASSSLGNGNAGNIFIQASDSVSLVNSSVYSDAFKGSVGNSGDINIQANSLSLADGSQLFASTYTNGNAGNVLIKVNNAVSLIDSFIASRVEAGGVGNGGNINIQAGSLSLKAGSTLETAIVTAEDNLPAGRGNGGNVNLDIRGAVTIDGVGINDKVPSGIISFVGTGRSGNGGNVTINAESLSLNGDARLNLSLFGNGNAGSVFINVNNAVSLANNSLIASNVGSGGVGNGGNITINADSLSITNDAALGLSLFGKGNAGSVFINVNDFVSLVDGNIFNAVEAGGIGNGGDINIKAGSLSLTDNAQMQTLIKEAGNNLPGGRGNGGNVNIDVSGKVIFAKASSELINGIITEVQTGAEGKGGNVNINAGSVEITGGSEIQSSTRGKGNSGTITINARDTINFDGADSGKSFSRAINSVQPGAEGNAGGIRITTGSLFLNNNAFLSSSTNGLGNAGDITINARDVISLNNEGQITNNVFKDGKGKAGNTLITTGSLSLLNGSQITGDVSGKGEGGNITINARDTVKLDGSIGSAASEIGSALLIGAEGKGGNIQISTGALSVSNGAAILTNTGGKGDAGDITINARDIVTFEGFGGNSNLPSQAITAAISGSKGNGGNIRVTARELLLKRGGQLSASSFGDGGSGNIFIDAQDIINIDGVGGRDYSTSGLFSLMSGTTGNGGDIQIKTGSLAVTNGGVLGTFGVGDVGDIIINARDSVKFDGFGNRLRSQAGSGLLRGKPGRGGDIQITTGSLTLSNLAGLTSGTSGQGDGGDITINARDNISFVSGGFINASTEGQGKGGNVTLNAGNTVEGVGSDSDASFVASIVFPGATGKAGDLRVTAKNLSLTSAFFFNGTLGKGDAGNTFVQIAEDISLNNGFIDSSVLPGGVGNGGNVDIQTRNLTVTNGGGIGSQVYRSTQVGNTVPPGGKGQGGNIRINATDSVTLSGISPSGFSSAISTLTERGASGDAGDIFLTTKNFRATGGAGISAATSNASNGGDIIINADIFELFDGAQVLTNTRSSGNAGNISLNVNNRITIAGSDPNFNQRLALAQSVLTKNNSTDELTDVVTNQGAASGLFASTAPGATGNGGSILIDPELIIIRDGGRISVNSEGAGNTGNIFIQGDNLFLENNGAITARAANRNGGNITLNLANLLVLRKNSEISATAGTAGAGGNGGNININSKYIVAIPKENSNISANASEGNGGRVQINTQGLFGAEFRPQETAESDITASSSFGLSGTVAINSPNNSSIQNNLGKFPQNFIDTNALLARSCIARRNQQNGTLFITGAGNLPLRPGDAPLSHYGTGDVQGLPVESATSGEKRRWQIGDPIVEPSGVYELPNGRLVLGKEC